MEYKYKKRGTSFKPLLGAFAIVAGVFGGYYTAAGLDSVKSPPKISSPLTPKVQTERKQTLEDIINSSQKIITKSTYEINYFDSFGNEVKKEIPLYSFGSSICIYKNLDEKNLFFLTCDHVTTAPEEMYVIGDLSSFKKVEKNLYETKLKTKNKEDSFYVLLEENKPFDFGIFIHLAKLKSVSLGIYQETIKDEHGEITDFKTIPLTELADTNFKDDDPDWVKNNDISLLKVDTSKMNDLEIFSNLNKFSVWDGKWADYASMKQGDLLKVVGYPSAFERQINSGELTSKEGIEKSLNNNFYFTSAHLNPGNSGGPVFLVRETYKIVNNQVVKEQEFYFAGLARLGAGGEGLGGILRPDIIEKFLIEQGYGYLIKK